MYTLRRKHGSSGFSLLEVLLGVALSSLLITGIVQLLMASISAYRVQLNHGQLVESSHFARDVLIEHISQAGYTPQPWNATFKLPALTNDTLEGSALPGDQLGLQRWTRKNCYGNENSVTDSQGLAAFYLLQSRFRVSAAGNLALTCRYGPGPSQLTTQINNFGLVEGVESMQLLYAEDRDDDGVADRWVKAGQWLNEKHVRAVKVALLMATEQPVKQSASSPFMLLDEAVQRPADGRLRRVNALTTAIRGRLR